MSAPSAARPEGTADSGGALSREQLAAWAERDERSLRDQMPSGRFDAGAEAELASAECDPATLTGALRRWALIKHLWRAWSERLPGGEAEPAAAALQLLAREPVDVPLQSGRRVQVTGRSYAALYEIARHWLRVQVLEAEIRRAAALEARCLAAAADAASRRGRARARHRFRRAATVHAELLAESELQRQALFAHVFTADGAPSASIDDVPAWWVEITPADDARLLAAVWEAGAGRFARLGEKPAAEQDAPRREPLEDFGWHSHFARLERQLKLEPASLSQADLFQHLAWLRAAADAPIDDGEMEDLG